MSNGSPSAYLLWAILSCIFLAFLILHLWAYDRFNCLKWDAGRQPGAFKRIMTYCYLGTVPLLVVFSVTLTAIKFSEGYYVLPSGKIISKPLILWHTKNRNILLPLYFVLSIAWSLELVTHLEELTFWLFLLHQGPRKREWFHSWEFRSWCIGTVIAILGMPLTAFLARRVLETCQAYIFLVGSLAGTTTTVCFLYVLLRFPAFIKHVKAGGAEPEVVVRLTAFYQLNRTRVIFRFLFTIPLLIIAIDGIRAPFTIVTNPFALDFLLMMGGIGCFVSSAITLLIFFPRSFTHEAGYKEKIHTSHRKLADMNRTTHVPKQSLTVEYSVPAAHSYSRTFRFSGHTQPEVILRSPGSSSSHLPESRRSLESAVSPDYDTDAESEAVTSHTMPPPSLRTAEQHRPDFLPVDFGWEGQRGAGSSTAHAEVLYSVHATTSLPPHPRRSSQEASFRLHPYVLHFTSPIDLVDLADVEPRTRYPQL